MADLSQGSGVLHSLSLSEPDSAVDVELDDSGLALGWSYSAVVHADDAHEAAYALAIAERFAAANLVGLLASFAVDTLDWIGWLVA
jgi:hypothetical protein